MSCQSQLRCSAVGGPQLFESVIYPSINHLPLECKCLLASVSSECLLGFIVLAVLGLRCCAPAFSSCNEPELLFIMMHRFLLNSKKRKLSFFYFKVTMYNFCFFGCTMQYVEC